MKTIRELKAKLENEIKKSSQVFIVGHNEPDFDSIGSCIGLYTIAKYYKKPAYIIVDDDPSILDAGVKTIMDDTINKYNYIKKSQFLDIVHSNALLLMTDVNNKSRTAVGDCSNKFRKIIAIDHHYDSEPTIPLEDKYITFDVSSACEIVTSVLEFAKIPYDNQVANYLLAGINLDTKRFKQNVTANTHDTAEKLLHNGADTDYVNSLFFEEFESFCRICNLIIHGTVIKKYTDSRLAPIQVSFTINRSNPQEINAKEDYAKVADRLLKFRGFDAAFVLGYVAPGIVHISARSNKKVDVGTVMKGVHGGGNLQSAGGRILTENIYEVEQKLMESVPLGLSDDEEPLDEPQVVLAKQRKRYSKN